MLPIWEGTTNILSLDVLRALQKSNGEVSYHKTWVAPIVFPQALQAVVHRVKSIIGERDRIQFLGLESEARTVSEWLEAVTNFIKQTENDHNVMTTASRDFAFSLAYIYTGML